MGRSSDESHAVSHWACACCYLVGGLTFGLGSLIIVLVARLRDRPRLALHATQSLFWNWLVGLLTSVGLFLGLVAILVAWDQGQEAEFTYGMLLEWLVIVWGSACAANTVVNFWAAARTGRGGRFRFPWIGRTLFDGYDSEPKAPGSRYRRQLEAVTYIFGSLTWGLGSLIVLAYARRQRLPTLAFHALQSMVVGAAMGILLLLLPPIGFALALVLPVATGAHPAATAWVTFAVLIAFILLIPLTWAAGWWLGWRTLRGEEVLLPVVGKWLSNRTSPGRSQPP